MNIHTSNNLIKDWVIEEGVKATSLHNIRPSHRRMCTDQDQKHLLWNNRFFKSCVLFCWWMVNNGCVLRCCVSPVSQDAPLYPDWQWQTGSPLSVTLHSPCTQRSPLQTADSSLLSQNWPEYPSAQEQLYEEPLGTHTPCTHLHRRTGRRSLPETNTTGGRAGWCGQTTITIIFTINVKYFFISRLKPDFWSKVKVVETKLLLFLKMSLMKCVS